MKKLYLLLVGALFLAAIWSYAILDLKGQSVQKPTSLIKADQAGNVKLLKETVATEAAQKVSKPNISTEKISTPKISTVKVRLNNSTIKIVVKENNKSQGDLYIYKYDLKGNLLNKRHLNTRYDYTIKDSGAYGDGWFLRLAGYGGECKGYSDKIYYFDNNNKLYFSYGTDGCDKDFVWDNRLSYPYHKKVIRSSSKPGIKYDHPSLIQYCANKHLHTAVDPVCRWA